MKSKNLETQTPEKNTEPKKVKKHKKTEKPKKIINTKNLEKPNDPKTQKKTKIRNS